MALQPRFAKHSVSSLLKQKREVDPVFQGAGQKEGLEIWWIDSWGLQVVPVPGESYEEFYTGHCFIVLKTTALKKGSFRHDIHCWLGKDTSQDEARTAAIKTAELDAALGTGRAVQYREAQGNETEKFLSYFKPCIIPEEVGDASGFSLTEANNTNHGGIAAVEDGKLMADDNNSVSLSRITREEVGAASEDGKLMADGNNGVSLPMDAISEILQMLLLYWDMACPHL